MKKKINLVFLKHTFRWRPVVFPIRCLQKEILDVAWRRDAADKTAKYDKATSSEYHLPVKATYTQTQFLCYCVFAFQKTKDFIGWWQHFITADIEQI